MYISNYKFIIPNFYFLNIGIMEVGCTNKKSSHFYEGFSTTTYVYI